MNDVIETKTVAFFIKGLDKASFIYCLIQLNLSKP